MISKICSVLRICPVEYVQSLNQNSITLKEGKSIITIIQKRPGSFSIKSYETLGGYRKDFTMQSIIPTSEKNKIYPWKRAMILLIQTSTGDDIIIGSTEFPVKAEFSEDNNITTIDFKQSEPG